MTLAYQIRRTLGLLLKKSWTRSVKASELRVATMRSRAPIPPGGQMANLSYGACHYMLDNSNGTGPLVLIITGFIGCAVQFGNLADEVRACLSDKTAESNWRFSYSNSPLLLIPQ